MQQLLFDIQMQKYILMILWFANLEEIYFAFLQSAGEVIQIFWRLHIPLVQDSQTHILAIYYSL